MSHLQPCEPSSPFLSTLPPELLDEILSQKSLSKSDLARCCLVSRQFLQLSRPSLYSTISCDFVWTPELNRMDIKSFNLLRTLRSSSVVRQCLGDLRFDIILEGESDDWDERMAEAVEVTSFSGAIVEMLNLASRVTRLALASDHFGGVLRYLCLHGSRWTELNVRHLALGVDSTSESDFKNLRKLYSFRISPAGDGCRIRLPPDLDTLEFVSISHPLTIINASTAPLRFLRLEITAVNKLPDIVKLPQLQHLYVYAWIMPCTVSSVAGVLNRCGGLVSLSLDYSEGDRFDSVSDLLPRLDLPIICLRFPESAPLADLAGLITSGHFKTVRTLSLSKQGLQEDFSMQDLAILSQVCRIRGISIEYIDRSVLYQKWTQLCKRSPFVATPSNLLSINSLTHTSPSLSTTEI
ncbi:hypothetical protein JCM3765_006892 [Sporobolomyces pararoseus]